MIKQSKPPSYAIEGNVNFFSELAKSLNVNAKEEEEKEEDNSSTCLITNAQLTPHYVTLKCNHSFNYLPLYNEINAQKTVKNTLEVVKLGANQLKCPYCRCVQTGILPFCEELSEQAPFLYGVNTVNVIYRVCFKCNYVKYTDSENAPVFCTGLPYLTMENDNKSYCYSHFFEMKRLAKIKAKMETILKKTAEKLAKAQAKAQAKSNTSCTSEAPTGGAVMCLDKSEINEVISISQQKDKCAQILKTGSKKGCQCSQNVYKENVCKRHYTLNHSKETNDALNN